MLYFPGLERQRDLSNHCTVLLNSALSFLLSFQSLWFHLWFCPRMLLTNFKLFSCQACFFYSLGVIRIPDEKAFCLETPLSSDQSRAQNCSSKYKERSCEELISCQSFFISTQWAVHGLRGWLRSTGYIWVPWDFSELSGGRKWWNQLSHELGGGHVHQGFPVSTGHPGREGRRWRGSRSWGSPDSAPHTFPCSSEAMIASRPISSPNCQSLHVMVSMAISHVLHSRPYMTMIMGQ